jgi:RNA polymerase sigma factor (sigma-70 family)
MTAKSMEHWIHQLRRTALLSEAAGLSDSQLLQSFILRREAAAFEALLRRHGPMVFGVCRRILRHSQDAEDAFQATWLVFIRKANSISPADMVANWLYGVAYRTALKAKAATARRWAKERHVFEIAKTEIDSEAIWRELEPILDLELNRLPDKYRIPIVLCDLERKTRKEAARQLGWPEGTISGRLARGRVMLAKRISRHGLSLGGGALAMALSGNAASANLPPSLVISTIKAATFIAAGHATAAAGMISAKVASLTEGVVKTMLLTKLKIATGVLLAAGVLGTGIFKVGHGAVADQGASAEGLQAQPKKTASGIAPGKPRSAKAKNDLDSKLNSTISLDFKDTPLCEVIDHLRAHSGINIVVDRPALEKDGLSLDCPVTMKLEGVTFKTALTLILHQAQMDYTIRDRILTVTPLRWLLILKTYKVADLLDSNGKEDTLIRIITRVVEPTSWVVMGGPGTIDFWPLGNALTVNQTSEVHERIQALLDGFRELREKAPNTKQTKNEGQERQKLEPNASAAQPGQNQSSMGITVVIRANKDAKYVQVAKVVKFLEAKKATKVDAEVNDHPGTAISAEIRASRETAYIVVFETMQALRAAGVDPITLSSKP